MSEKADGCAEPSTEFRLQAVLCDWEEGLRASVRRAIEGVYRLKAELRALARARMGAARPLVAGLSVGFNC